MNFIDDFKDENKILDVKIDYDNINFPGSALIGQNIFGGPVNRTTSDKIKQLLGKTT